MLFFRSSNIMQVRGDLLVKINRMFKIDFIALNQSKMIQLQFATSRIKIGPLEPEIQPAKGARNHYTLGLYTT